MARSLNKVQLIGNLTRDPELRYTPNGNAVCSFSIATNRNWTTDTGEKREEVDFHRIIAWNKLAELCSQFLIKGRKVYVEGRLANRSWTGQDGVPKSTTEIVINDMILLDKAGAGAPVSEHQEGPKEKEEAEVKKTTSAKGGSASGRKKEEKAEETPASENNEEEVMPDDIPF